MLLLSEIEKFAPGVVQLSPMEVEALQRFTLLWTLFESQVLDNNASVKKISEKVEAIDLRKLGNEWFQAPLSYFSKRYIEDGRENYRFENLHLRKNDNPDLVRTVLTGEIDNPSLQLIVCLTIVYRFRNNFFHGIKWAYGLQEQFENFTHSSNLLSEYLERV
ncbi:hypothetical protein I5462_12550 [Citrobacter freundii]|uniref:hypothetical protein n=1 Tax=Citrobacter freundii TaxID=546 RepID=UPI000C80303E|nr:hypothetical protein [Citrobacter freundii]EMB4337254.1 hypothetical protein [Citrobacter freundii]MBJ9041900.1 hypothetical protein [Citrobacter freundii]NTY76600.1 hypothetical protein [Citrobacter freundii]NUA13048.1 hypothetical protein [Citrobacter freundii]PMD03478.1 hypothetical protein CJ200_02145 [Citrobacter freundii]